MSLNTREQCSALIHLPSGESLEIVYYEPSQPGRSASVVMFLPFWGGCAHTFKSVLGSLALYSPDSALIAFSYPGTGKTRRNIDDNRPESHTPPKYAAAILSAMQQPQLQPLLSGRQISICAHSMSAKVVYEMLQMTSSQLSAFNLTINSLLLLAPAPPKPFILPTEIRQQQLTAYSNFESAEWNMRNILTKGQLSDAAIIDLATDATNMSEGAKRGWIELGMAHDCIPSLQRVKEIYDKQTDGALKISVLVGSEDMVETVERVRSETVSELLALGWKVNMRVLEGQGHILPLEASDEVVKALREMLDPA